MKLFLNCTEAYQSCDKNQYKEASFWDVVKLKVHILYCSVCRKYSVRNNKLTKVFAQATIKTMPQPEKKILKERLRTEMSKDQ